MRMSESIADLAGALAKAQGEIKGAAKDSANPHFKSRYADLASIWEACRGPLAKHGLAVVQGPATEEGGQVSVTTLLAHASGQWIETTVAVAPMKFDAQGVGSVVTYLRRYALAAMAGVAPDDDDGEAAVGRGAVAGNGQARPPSKPPVQAAPPASNGAEPKHAAWVRKAAETIDGMQTRAALEEWQRANQATLNKLAEMAPEERDRLAGKMSAKWGSLPPKSELTPMDAG